jgi:Flp pilus assembly protein TadG
MNHRPRTLVELKGKRGATLIYVALIATLLLGVTALAVDVGYFWVVRNQLQNAADAAALGATRRLGSIYATMTYLEQQSYVCSPAEIVAVAQEVAVANVAGAQNVSVVPSDVVIGTWDSATSVLTPTLNQPDAVQVTARRDDTPGVGGRVGTFFARILGFQDVSVTATAVAALTGQSTAVPGELQLPVGVSISNFEGAQGSWCGQVIKFSPTTDPEACAGWTTFEVEPANDRQVREILNGTLENQYVVAGDTEFQFINGDLSEGTFERLLEQYRVNGHDVDQIYDPATGVEPEQAEAAVPLCMASNNELVQCGTAGTTLGQQLRYPPCTGAGGCSGPLRYAHEWVTGIPVYDSTDCTPGRDMPIAGFAEVVVYNVGMPSNKIVAARIRCNFVDPEPTRGGGGNYGRKGSIPGLVR